MIYDRIKTLREDAGYSQAELARKLDVTRSSLMRGKWDCQLPQPRTLLSLLSCFMFQPITCYA